MSQVSRFYSCLRLYFFLRDYVKVYASNPGAIDEMLENIMENATWKAHDAAANNIHLIYIMF